MKAMVLAAGLGTRLGSITKDCPKALVPVGAETMLSLVLKRIRALGVDEVIINLHYLPGRIRNYLEAAENFGLSITYSEEPEILGTGGGIRNVENYFSGEEFFLVHNCDVYSDVDIGALVAAHRQKGAIATLATTVSEQESYLLFTPAGELVGWESADRTKRDLVKVSLQEERSCFTGISVLGSAIFEHMRDEPPSFPIVRTYVRAAKAGKLVQSYPIGNSFWIDVGTPQKLEELRRRVQA